ncbi:MAG: hypothetical protein Kow0077_08210 [Anaerolineae bacterium]
MLALLFVAPATIITLTFRIWPVIYGFFVSLHQWRARTHNFLGLDQYVRALGNAAYVIAFFLVILLSYGGYRVLRSARAAMAEGKGNFYPYLLPGSVLGVGTVLLSVGLAAQLSAFRLWGLIVILAGAGVYQMVHRRYAQPLSGARYGVQAWQLVVMWLLAAGLFVFTISEILLDSALAFELVGELAPDLFVPPLQSQMIGGAVLAAAIALYALARYWRDRQPDDYDGDRMRTLLNWVMLVVALVGIGALIYLISAFQFDQAAAAAVRDIDRNTVGEVGQALTGLDRSEFRRTYGTPKGEDLAHTLLLWPQVISVSLGFLLMFTAYRTWVGAVRRETALGTGGQLLTAIMIAVGGWLLIGELPQAMAVGDAGYFNSLLITTTYALGTVPVQLSLGLFLAYLMFYEVTIGKSLYRMIYFLPYVAPTVATATVFGIIFSSRGYSLANKLLGLFGIPAQAWLFESRGVFQIIAEMINPDVTLPAFLVGPSLALISIILYNIWVFAGYNAVIFLAGLGAIPGDLYEAAKVDGAGRWAAFRRITFPLLSPTTFFLTILSVTGTFRAFTHIYVMREAAARGTADTASVYIFVQFWQFNQWGYASAMAFVLFGIILILTLVQNKVSEGRVFYG